MTDTLPDRLRIALVQTNPVVGDLDGNLAKARAWRGKAQAGGADIVVFSELFITGYPPEDLVLKPAFQHAARDRIEALAADTTSGPAVIIGTIWEQGGKLFNAVAVLDGGAVQAVRFKVELPNYGVFDEKRVFEPGPLPSPVAIRGVKIGLPICEDIWLEQVTECLAECGAEILVSPNGSPFDWPKPERRMSVAAARVAETRLPIAYLNQVGGQDELVFDGASFVLNGDHSLAVQMPAWEEALLLTEWHKSERGWSCLSAPLARIEQGVAAAYSACVLGLRDYVYKNGFPGVVLGLSGGIDSALVAAIAVDALGAEKVHAVMLPYRYTSDESLKDAAACAKALGLRYNIVPIKAAVAGLSETLATVLGTGPPGLTEENLQSRLRGTALMAISNKFGAMVVTTGNKSEMSVGYATLYGDMNGGFNPIKDLYKMEVYQLAHWRNEAVPRIGLGPGGVVIPPNIIQKAPTAELRDNQKDQDSLPSYEVLDEILKGLIEQERPVAEIIARGFDAGTVRKVERLLYLAEYKRRQAAPGVKISARNFGRDRRYPITNRFRE